MPTGCLGLRIVHHPQPRHPYAVAFSRGALAFGVLRLNAGRAAALIDLFAALIQFVEKIVVSGHQFTVEDAKIFGHGFHGLHR